MKYIDQISMIINSNEIKSYNQKWDKIAEIIDNNHFSPIPDTTIDYIKRETVSWPSEVFEVTTHSDQELTPSMQFTRKLSIHDCSEGHLIKIFELLKDSKLNLLSIWDTPMSRTSIALMKEYITMDDGSGLWFFDTHWGMNELRDFLDWKELKNLSSLMIRAVELGDEGAELISRSDYLSRVTSLDLSATGISKSGIESIINSTVLSRVNSLYLECMEMNDECVSLILNSKLYENLRYLIIDVSLENINSCLDILISGQLDDYALEVIRNCVKSIAIDSQNGSLQVNSLYGLDLVNFVLKLADSGISDHLCDLNLGFKCLDDDCIQILSDSEHVVKVKRLSICGNNIGPQAFIALSKSDHVKNIEYLDVTHTLIGKIGVSTLANSSKLIRMNSLQVHWSDICDDPDEASFIMSRSNFPLSIRKGWSYEADLEAREALSESLIPDELDEHGASGDD